MNNEHAARLRAMAQYTSADYAAALLAGAEALERQERDLQAIKAADAAPTEAMETISDLRGGLEVAKAALRLIQRNRIGDGGPCEFAGQACICSECTATAALSTWTRFCAAKRPCTCSECTVTAALARLEGK